MKIKQLALLVTFTLGLGSTLAQTSAKFEGINLARKGRNALVETAIEKKFVYEGELGFLQTRTSDNVLALKLVEVENEDRKRQFSLVAKSKKSTPEAVGREFAKINGYSRFGGAETILRLHGSNTIGATLAPALVKDFLERQIGANDVIVQRSGVETTIFFEPKDTPGKYSAVEIVAHGSSTAFKETKSNKNVGLAGGYCDIGMASRPIKDSEAVGLIEKGISDLRDDSQTFPIAVDGVAVILHPRNPIDKLSVLQIAKLFSGEIKNWKELGGPNLPVSIYSRDAQSGTFDTFKSKVLKPTKKSLSKSLKGRFEENSAIVKEVSKTRGGIGFIGLSSLNQTVRAVSIKAADDTRAFFPSRLTLKSLDYPLSRLLYLYAPSSRSQMASDLLGFVMSDAGQSRVDQEGLIGQGLATTFDRKQAEEFKKQLVADTTLPAVYRKAISDADRGDTGFNVRFSSGQIRPDANSTNNLRRLVSLLAEPKMEDASVVLIGFADSRGDDKKNEALSKRRADAVGTILEQYGVTKINTHGLGEIMPVGDNTIEAGRAANRRVEVWLKRN